MSEYTVSFQFKGRYYTSGEITQQTSHILFALHGYGQLAQYFIRKFSALESKNVVVIAPEGLSKFYLEPIEGIGRKSSRVGATWMTKENREVDIENYLTFLNAVYAEVLSKSPSHAKVSILGFSQGSATASRWILSDKIKFERLILWAGILPPDMNFELGSEILKGKSVLFVYGKQDPFLTDDRFKEMQSLADRLNAKVDVITFEGGHDIDQGALFETFK